MPSTKTQILVVGAGGVGGYYGAKLLAAGFAVEFLVREATCRALQQNGLQLKSVEGDRHFANIEASTTPLRLSYAAVILTVKAMATQTALANLQAVVRDGTPIVSLQNGIDNEEKIAAAFPNAHIIGGVAFVGSRQLAAGVIEHRAEGRATLGPWRHQDEAAAKQLCEWFETAGIRTKYSNDIRRDLWTKLLWNAAFNTTSCLAGANVIDVLRAPGGQALARAIMHETAAVASAEGVTVAATAIENFLADTIKMQWGTTSMLEDRRAGKPVEAAAIVGEPWARAQRHGLETPQLATLYALLSAYNDSLKDQ